MIKKFLRDNPIHKRIVPHLDFLFTINPTYYFINWALITWGFSASFYNVDGVNQYYFILEFLNPTSLFFIGYSLFSCLIHLRSEADEMEAFGTTRKIYVLSRMVSFEKVNLYYKIISLIGFILIVFSSPFSAIPILLAFITMLYINPKIIKTDSAMTFYYRCALRIFYGILLFSSGWIHFLFINNLLQFSNLSVFIYYLLPFICSLTAVYLMIEVCAYDKYSDEETKKRIIIHTNRKLLSFISLLFLVISFVIGQYYVDPILTHFSLISIPFFIYALIRSEDKDFIRTVTYPIMILNVILSWTLYPLLFIAQFINYYLSKYYYWHRFGFVFPTFVIEEND